MRQDGNGTGRHNLREIAEATTSNPSHRPSRPGIKSTRDWLAIVKLSGGILVGVAVTGFTAASYFEGFAEEDEVRKVHQEIRDDIQNLEVYQVRRELQMRNIEDLLMNRRGAPASASPPSSVDNKIRRRQRILRNPQQLEQLAKKKDPLAGLDGL